MKLKLVNILNSVPALQELSAEKLPIKLAYQIQRNIRLLNDELKTFEDARIKLIKEKHGQQEADGNYRVPPERMQEFGEDIAEMQSVELELDLHTIGMHDSIQISPNHLSALSWMFEEG